MRLHTFFDSTILPHLVFTVNSIFLFFYYSFQTLVFERLKPATWQKTRFKIRQKKRFT